MKLFYLFTNKKFPQAKKPQETTAVAFLEHLLNLLKSKISLNEVARHWLASPE